MSITLVSAFFDIGREKYEVLPRSKEKYINDFKRWARIKNDLIFYCDNKVIGDIVFDIRKEFGLESKTQIVVKDIFNVEPELLKQMEKIENDKFFVDFRTEKNIAENKANYNYVMLMKYYCVFDATNYASDPNTQLVWFDFGYEHGGETFTDENAYSFTWDYDFGGKVTLFRLPYEEQRPVFEVCRTVHPDSMMGAPVVIPYSLAEEYWLCIKTAMQSLCNVGLMDDDQLLLLMSSRMMPKEKLQVLKSYWFEPIKDFGGSHFVLKPSPKKPSIITRGLRKIKRIFKKIFKIKG